MASVKVDVAICTNLMHATKYSNSCSHALLFKLGCVTVGVLLFRPTIFAHHA